MSLCDVLTTQAVLTDTSFRSHRQRLPVIVAGLLYYSLDICVYSISIHVYTIYLYISTLYIYVTPTDIYICLYYKYVCVACLHDVCATASCVFIWKILCVV